MIKYYNNIRLGAKKLEPQKSKRMSGARILVETLIEQGVTDVFGIPGGQVVDIYDELNRARRRIRHILTSHEQGAAHAADGYARVSGKVGVALATSGPGATNLVTGIAAAMLDSVPMVVITGNVSTQLIGRDSFQEINITGITFSITKHNYFVTDVNELADTVREAFRIASSGRPGPVLIDIPKDVQTAKTLFAPKAPEPPDALPHADEKDVLRAAEIINRASRPYLYIGGGAAANGMGKQIMEFAEKTDAFIGCSLMGISTVPSSYERFLGMQGMHGRYASTKANTEADVIIGVGVRFSDRATGDAKKYARRAEIVQIDADLAEINKNVIVDAGLVGDVKKTFSMLLDAVEQKRRPQWHKRALELKSEGRRIFNSIDENALSEITPKQVFEMINGKKEADTVVATDVGQHQMWAAQYLKFEKPRRFISSGGLGAMGYGLGAAIGAVIAEKKRAVLVTGDGSFSMNLTELATAVSYKIPVVIVLMNNSVLGMVRQWQTLFYGGRYPATDPKRKTDFVKVCEAFGGKGERVSSAEEFEAAFERAMKFDGPYLIDVPVDKDELVLPMIPSDGDLEDLITTDERKNKQ